MTQPDHDFSSLKSILWKIFLGLSLAFWIWILLDLFTHPDALGPNEGGNIFRWMSALTGSVTVVTALFIMRRVPQNPVGPLLLAWGVGAAGWSLRVEWADQFWGSATLGTFSLYFFCISIPAVILMCFYFPNGKVYPPGLARWTPIIAMLLAVAGLFYPLSYSSQSGPGNIANPFTVPALAGIGFSIFLFGFLVGMSGALVSLVLRFRAADVRQRMQLKWLVWLLGIGILFGVIPIDRLLGARIPALAIIGFLFWQSFPALSIGIALLRHNLWDIDIIIRKTLVYGVLSFTLALVFFGGVTLLQGVFGRITGTESSPIAIVLSTLLIAALFGLLRRRIQDFIDRRFYRQKYNAEQALANFAASARNETDLEALSGKLVEVVTQTMQPERVTLWLRKGKL